MPRATREELRARRHVLNELRAAIAERVPAADVEPVNLTRFGRGTLVSVVLPVLAVVLILTKVNFDEVVAAVETSDWRWVLVAFGLGLMTFLGAALTFRAFSPIRVPLRTVTLVQAAAAFVAMAAPAGLGAGALNLRMLVRRGVGMSLAVATVALAQVSQFVVTVLLLLVLSAASGSNEASQLAPSGGVLLAAAGVVLAVGSALLVPAVRRRVFDRVGPILRQTWPRLIDVVGQPGRVAVALLGDVLLAASWVLAFAASVAAFGQHLSILQVAVIYFAGNLAGSAVPTPGGVGGIEVALGVLLTAAGINPGVAASIVLLFRVATYWVQIPIGWCAMRVLRRTGEL
jgi:glycosyltransferase 2 family protein